MSVTLYTGCVKSPFPKPVDLSKHRGYHYKQPSSWYERREAQLKKEHPDALFTALDPEGDDRGPGTYLYPYSSTFTYGTFDLRKFEVFSKEKVVEFRVTLQEKIKTSLLNLRAGGKTAWLYQLIDIYIDKDRIPGSGEFQALPGRDVVFDRNFGWEQMIFVSPEDAEATRNYLRDKSELIGFGIDELEQKIIVPSYTRVEDRTFVIKIPKDLIGEPGKEWAYQVLLMPYEQYDQVDTLKNKRIKAFASDSGFGGGSDYYGNPNIMDMLVPAGEDQYTVLSNFSLHPDRTKAKFASISMVCAEGD